MGRPAVMITYKGETKSASEWGREFNLSHATVISRLRRGWTPEQVLETPLQERFRNKRKKANCGRKTWRDCLNCPYPDGCVNLSAPAMKGESASIRNEGNSDLLEDDYTRSDWPFDL